MKPRRHLPRPYILHRAVLDPLPLEDVRAVQSIPSPKLNGSAPNASPRAKPLLVQFDSNNATQRPLLGTGVWVRTKGT